MNPSVAKHFWHRSWSGCKCGCNQRVMLDGRWWCLEALKEQLEVKGIKLINSNDAILEK